MELAQNVFDFGKHRGRTFEDVRQKEKKYVTWCQELDNPQGKMKSFCDYIRAKTGGYTSTPSSTPAAVRGQIFQCDADGVLQAQPRITLESPASSVSLLNDQMPDSHAQASASSVQYFPDTLHLEVRKGGFVVTTENYIPMTLWSTINSWNGDVQPNRRSWFFPSKRYREILGLLQHNDKFSCPVVPLPDWVRKAIKFDKLPQGDGSDVETNLVHDDTGLLPFQREGVKFALQHDGKVLLGDEMGLGKTVQALCIMKNYPETWPVLVACPSSLRFVWKEAALDWIDSSVNVQIIQTGKQEVDPEAKLVVVSYALLAKNEQYMSRADGKPYQMVICDESQYIKDPKSQRTKALLKVAKLASRVLLLSGTPALNRSCELYTQLVALRPTMLPSYSAFCDRYANKEKIRLGNRVVEKWVGAKRKEELHALLVKSFMIRRLKKDVLTQLPPKRRQKITLDPKSLDKKKIKAIQDLLSNASDQNDIPKQEDTFGELSLPQIFQLTAQAKVDAVLEYIDVLLELNVKFLLFAHHHLMLDKLEECLQAKTRGNYIRIDGKTNQELRPELIKKFQEDSEVRVALLSITACGQGLTLTAASTVVFAELYWVPGQLMQAEDRVHRIGQYSAVNVQYLVAPDTLDDLMYASLNKKARDTTGILDGHERCMGADERSAKQGTRTLEASRSMASTPRPENDKSDDDVDVMAEVRRMVTARKQQQKTKRASISPLTTSTDDRKPPPAKKARVSRASITSAARGSCTPVPRESPSRESIADETPLSSAFGSEAVTPAAVRSADMVTPRKRDGESELMEKENTMILSD
eukprot:GEMP01011019.1.p1 GENE.GEMP01011019.1~~GEMP01011019.1.p1  ORF type:complete len:819 (+),score=152.29 GEMP01011019.1:23-2458(+)